MTASVEERFARIEASYRDDTRVTEGSGFGASPALKVHDKIFAMLVKSQLVVKLPSDQVDRLIAEGIAEPLQMGTKSPMREWVRVPVEHSRRWSRLASEALEFVASISSKRAL
jgi:hypothetical protein